MRVCLAALAAVACIPWGLSAQDQERPADWRLRADRPGSDIEEIFFVNMEPGWHITSGPAAIYYNPATRASGVFRVESEIFLFDPQGRREAFGIFVGGQDLEADSQRYVYFLIRASGEFLIKRREGGDTPTLVGWTQHDAVVPWSAKGPDDETVLNVLALEADGEQVRFLVNDIEVGRLPRAELAVDGVVGLRVNHALNLHVSSLEVSSLSGSQ